MDVSFMTNLLWRIWSFQSLKNLNKSIGSSHRINYDTPIDSRQQAVKRAKERADGLPARVCSPAFYRLQIQRLCHHVMPQYLCLTWSLLSLNFVTLLKFEKEMTKPAGQQKTVGWPLLIVGASQKAPLSSPPLSPLPAFNMASVLHTSGKWGLEYWMINSN